MSDADNRIDSSALQLLDGCIASHRAGQLEEWELQLVRRRLLQSEIACRNAVIEECARICDGFTSNPNSAEYAYRCASAIRDLKSAEPKAEKKPTIRVQYVVPSMEQIEKAHKSGIVNEGDVRLVWIVEADLWPLYAPYTVQEFKP